MLAQFQKSRWSHIVSGAFLFVVIATSNLTYAQDEIPSADSVIPLDAEQVLMYDDGKWTDQATGQEFPFGTHMFNTRGGLLRLEKGEVVLVYGDGPTAKAGYIELNNGGNGVIASLIPFAIPTPAGDWSLFVQYRGKGTEISVPPAEILEVKAEKYDRLPLFDENRTWNSEMPLIQTRSTEGIAANFALDPASVVVRAGNTPDSEVFELDKDYKIQSMWCAIGRTPESRIREDQPVWIDYRYGKMRLDSIVLTPSGRLELRPGTPEIIMPEPPPLAEGEKRLGNLWIKARQEKLWPVQYFPVVETEYPEPPKVAGQTVAENLLPKTMSKLNGGEKLRIIAWGDSVTVGTYLPDYEKNRWQEQFVKRLRERFPNADIELTTEAWGGRGSIHYLTEPSGSEYNFQERIVDPRPDLVIMEFVNDAGLEGDALDRQYGKILDAFRQVGAEWIIMTPHYVRPDWMGLGTEVLIDDDPRAYTQSVREFAEKNGIAVAEGAKRYGHLWRQGIPYSTLMVNGINHPNTFGMKLFADALMELFP